MCLVAEAQLYCSAILCFSCFDARTILLWTPTNSCSLSSVYYQIWDYAESPTNPQTFLNPNLHDLFDLMFEILLACVFRTLSVSFETKQFWGLPKYNYALGWSCKNYILLGAFFSHCICTTSTWCTLHQYAKWYVIQQATMTTRSWWAHNSSCVFVVWSRSHDNNRKHLLYAVLSKYARSH